MPTEEVVLQLAAEASLSAAQVNRWFSRRALLKDTVVGQLPRAGRVAAAAEAEVGSAGVPSCAASDSRLQDLAPLADFGLDVEEEPRVGKTRADGASALGSWRKRLQKDRELVPSSDELVDGEDDAEGIADEEEDEAEEEHGAGDADEDIDAIARRVRLLGDPAGAPGSRDVQAGPSSSDSPRARVAERAVVTEDMRSSSDMVDWDMLTPQALHVVQQALKPRKQEYLVLENRPVGGSKEKVHEGPWFSGNAALGWAAVPDTEEMPRMADGTMMEWSNINTKLPSQEGYLPVDVDPPSEPALLVTSWDDMPRPPPDSDIVFQHPNWEADGRLAHASLVVGQVLEGYISDQHVYNGAFVDCGTEYNGCAARLQAPYLPLTRPFATRNIYVDERDWRALRDILDLDQPVKVRVRAVRNPQRFRFPLELDCLEPDVSSLLTVPPPAEPPIILYDDETIFDAALDAGREIPPEPDYEGMVQNVMEEVRQNFTPVSKPGEKKGKGKGKVSKEVARAVDIDEWEADPEEELDELSEEDV